MLTWKVALVFSLLVFLVEGDLDSNDIGIQSTATDKDSTSDEAPTESMNILSPDQPDEGVYFEGGPSAPEASQVTLPESAAAAANSVEDDEDESAEGGKKKLTSRSARPQSMSKPQRPLSHVHQDPALPPVIPVHVILSPAHPPQPIIPQAKALVRNRTSKRRSRTNRRQI